MNLAGGVVVTQFHGVATSVATMTWHPHLSALGSCVIAAIVAAWIFVINRRLRSRMSAGRTAVVLGFRIAAVAMMLLVLMDPSWSSVTPVGGGVKFLAALDVSPSMNALDGKQASRRDRASRQLDAIRKGLPSSATVHALEFDSEVRESGVGPARGGTNAVTCTDVGGCLMAIARRADLQSYAGLVLLTDGGDEPLDNIELPPLPLFVVGVGSDLAGINDLAIGDVEYPPSVEKDAQFEVVADITARGRLVGLGKVNVTLERAADDKWVAEGATDVNLTSGHATARFKTACATPGLRKFRVNVACLPNEMFTQNNGRTILVEVRRKSLHVLFYARELGAEFKMLRSDLGRDPGVTFTALLRTIGNRCILQGERLPGDEILEAGFPADAEAIGIFDVVIVGSVPPADWRGEQLAALRDYVEKGGAVVVLGGEGSFLEGGPQSAQLSGILPWRTADERSDLLRGEFPVSVSASADRHPITAGLGASLAGSGGATVESLNPAGLLKPGAIVLMTATVDRKSVPLVAVQRFGKGTVLAIASNTLWKWARRGGELEKAYATFWRQAVRNLASKTEGGQGFSVRWDKASYRPGERALADVRVTAQSGGAEPSLSATLSRQGENRTVPVEAVQGKPGSYSVKILFEKRDTYVFRLESRDSGATIETYEKILPVAPLLAEGAKMELGSKALGRLAQRGGGMFVGEDEVDKLVGELKARHVERTTATEMAVVSGRPWFVALFVCLLAAEWITRRKLNLF